VVRWLRQNLFSSPVSTAVTLTLLYLAVRALWSLYEWPCLNAIWSLPDNQTQACRAIRGIGACWAVIGEKYRFILFGTYPFDDQWRPALAVVVFVLLVSGFGPAVAARTRAHMDSGTGHDWLAHVGRIPRLELRAPRSLGRPCHFRSCVRISVGNSGGDKLLRAQIAIILFAGAYLAEVVCAGLQAVPKGQTLGRRSKLPAIKILCVLYVELIRGVPLVSLLFMASVMFPLFMPDGFNIVARRHRVLSCAAFGSKDASDAKMANRVASRTCTN
jgi:general L-amino acid transport system permease protein